MKYKKRILILTIILTLSSNSLISFSHSGRTDANGGHKDNKNVSGLGSYHYHHGMEAHLHPNGICPYSNDNSPSSTSTANSEAQNKAYKEQLEKNKGYDEGYNDALSEKENKPSSSNSSFREGYSLGYSKGVQVLEGEKNLVKETAKINGYNDGYSGKENQSSSYSDKHKTIYTSQYEISYKEGLDKRKSEIAEAKAKGKDLGLQDGYNKINREELEYKGNYIDDFMESYKIGYGEGEKKLSDDILIKTNEAYIKSFKNKELEESSYNNEHIKNSVLESYNKANEIFNNFLKNAPMIGQPLEVFLTYAEGNDKIKIGKNDINNNTFISISDKSKRKVKGVDIFINAIDENGYTSEVSDALIEGFLKKDFIDSYTEKSSYKRTNDGYIYEVYNFKLTNKISKSAPKKLSIIKVFKDNMVHEIKIYEKEPKNIRKYEKI